MKTSRGRRPFTRGLATAFLLIVGCFSVSLGAGGENLHGGGSTLIDPLMRKWIAEYRKVSETMVEYESTGSGMGITGMTDKSLDFGCTDAPMSDAELKTAADVGGAVVHVPMTLGAVTPIYNFPDLKEHFRFLGSVLAGIFLGQIHRWNDPELTALNPGFPLPDHEIAVVHRLDSSGTTYVWTDYLSKVSPEWQSTVGVGKTVPWPVGLAGRGNEGVAGLVKQNPWSIGYAQLAYGIRESLQYGSVKNAAGEFVEPLPGAITAAAEEFVGSIPEDFRFSMTNGPGTRSYPISSLTWAIAYTKQPSGKRKQITDFLAWATHDGQQFGEALDFAPLPKPLIERVDAKIKLILDSN
jgi:phosphate ABC transporter phosphate-binding protein